MDEQINKIKDQYEFLYSNKNILKLRKKTVDSQALKVDTEYSVYDQFTTDKTDHT